MTTPKRAKWENYVIKEGRYARREKEGMSVSQGSLIFDVKIHLMEKMDGVMKVRCEPNANASCMKCEQRTSVSLNNERKYETDVQVPVKRSARCDDKEVMQCKMPKVHAVPTMG